MFSIINQYSFVVTLFFSFALVQFIFWRFYPSWIKPFSVVILIIITVIISTVIIYNKNHGQSSAKDIVQGNLPNKPVLLYFYSDMWIACLVAKPAVSRLEKQINNLCDLIWIEVKSEEGRKVWRKYKSDTVPTFILLDKKGNELFRQNGSPPSNNKVLKMINSSKSISKKWSSKKVKMSHSDNHIRVVSKERTEYSNINSTIKDRNPRDSIYIGWKYRIWTCDLVDVNVNHGN